MKRVITSFKLGLVLVALVSVGVAQENTNPKPQMKAGTKEAAEAGKSMGHNVKHGRIVRGGKQFGKHSAKAGKHFGKGTKRAVKRVIS